MSDGDRIGGAHGASAGSRDSALRTGAAPERPISQPPTGAFAGAEGGDSDAGSDADDESVPSVSSPWNCLVGACVYL